MLDFDRLTAAYETAKADLLAERTPDGHWVGELSSSALSTATAVSALAMVRGVQGSGFGVQASGRREPPGKVESPIDPTVLEDLVRLGISYLVTQQNPDGGFGDTDLSHSNIATTYLVVAALHLAGVADQQAALLKRADAYLESKGRLDGLRKRYGIDKTFVVPIMTNLALAGLVDWKETEALPFELACVPQSWYRFVGMPVVSYAIPALVAIGQARYFHAPPWNPFARLIRWLSITCSLKVLRRMQPDSGGYLEATPLTSFVVMSLASLQCGPLAPRVDIPDGPRERETNLDRPATSRGDSRSELPTLRQSLAGDVIHSGVKFLINSIRPDGSWPIDTNLATWNTTLAINALAYGDEDSDPIDDQTYEINDRCLEWLLKSQHLRRHSFTGADPGGFGWSDLSGAVPDADDTPGALLALDQLKSVRLANTDLGRRLSGSFVSAFNWLIELQNRDGGWPTFCRGWGRLPFDRSGNDLTAHAIRALQCWAGWVGFERVPQQQRVDPAWTSTVIKRGLKYLARNQHADGSWSPLWFGNQDHPEEDNPVYGTAKVLMAYRDLGLMDSPEAQRGVAWLVGNQTADGGWGSGVWGRAGELKTANCKLQIANCDPRSGEMRQNAELGARSGVEVEELVTGSATGGHSVLSTQYSVLSTGQDDAMPDQSQIRNPQSAIRNLQSSVEETALAVEALLAACPSTFDVRPSTPDQSLDPVTVAVQKGLAWLIDRVERNEHRQPAPIGFYFAKLWYYERLYPLTFTVAALGRACRQFARLEQQDSHAEEASARAP